MTNTETVKTSLPKRLLKRYFLDALSAMALGLFSSLIIGLIIAQFAKIPGLSVLGDIASVAQSGPVVGAAIGVAIAWGMKCAPLAVFSNAVVGAVAYATAGGGPLGCYIAAVIGAELGNLVSGKTKIDIILVPIVTIITGSLVGMLIGPGVTSLMRALGDFIGSTTLMSPIPMGIIVSAVIGLALTAPISSAALCAMIFISGADGTLSEGLKLAAGAATAGCCAHMVGFAVASFKDNGVGGLIAQGLGTSMLQVGNIMRKPATLLPAVVASVITGPLSTTVFHMYNAGAAAGMGTSGLVGQIGTFDAMAAETGAWQTILMMLALHIVIPALIAWGTVLLLRKIGWIQTGDMLIQKK
ncbi:MAG: PTS sugar transporter subunit IIC [Eubacteriales bacterium]|nr:PTS sugar transporter subunit IIC [Eubacteriales bacterium]MDD3882655.1 PTS sugar transporter subunit IIC [Eubacteriales bacterium]MDD4512773.1 PTS sugar transporter subunit IIC [Eubacteriales bacterium]